MTDDPRIIWLQECTSAHAPLVGGKATGLGHLLGEGLRVPPGFAVTTRAYREHLEQIVSRAAAPDEMRRLVESTPASALLQDEVLAAYERLCEGQPLPVAIRSSATAEDLADASFAGQQETYLWVIGGPEVLHSLVRCWGSLFTPQAIAYRAHRQIPVLDLAMGVVVQRMVPAEVAGVMLTIDPLTGDRSQIAIEASYGLGAAVVNGEVTPDRFGVDKVTLEIRSRALARKSVAYRCHPGHPGTRLEPVADDEQRQPCLSDQEVIEIATLGKRMERAMGAAQDIEWAIGPGREIFLLQARPETVWSQKPRPSIAAAGSTVMDRILQNMRVGPGSSLPRGS